MISAKTSFLLPTITEMVLRVLLTDQPLLMKEAPQMLPFVIQNKLISGLASTSVLLEAIPITSLLWLSRLVPRKRLIKSHVMEAMLSSCLLVRTSLPQVKSLALVTGKPRLSGKMSRLLLVVVVAV